MAVDVDARPPTTHPSKPSGDRRRYIAAVVLLTAMQVLLRCWATAGGWFVWDDFWWHDLVARNGLWDVAGLSLGGHFSPLTYIPYYVLTAVFPYDWFSRAVAMVVVLLMINAGVLAVTRQLWPGYGPRLAVYVLWVFSSLVAPSLLWFSQFTMTGAQLLISTWVLWAYLRALTTRRPGPSWLAVGLLGVGLFAQERMVVTAVVLLAFIVAVCTTIPRVDLARRGWLWLGSASMVVVWLMVYTSLPTEPRSMATPAAGLEILWGLLRYSAIPALLGGPWVLNGDPVLRRSDIPVLLQVLACVVLLALIVWSRQVNPRALRAWSVLGFAAVTGAGLVVIGRGTTVAQFAVYDWRYFSDLAVLAPIAVVAAFVSPGTSPAFTRWQRQAFVVSCCLFVVSSLITLIPLATRWHNSTSKPYVQTAITEIQASGQAVLMDRLLPETVVNAELGPQRLASHVFSIIDSQIRFDVPTTEPLWLDDSGRLVPATLGGGRQSAPGGVCAHEVVGTQTTWVRIPGRVDLFDWGLWIDYSARINTRIGVTDGARTITVEVPAGKHTLYVPMPGVGEQAGFFTSSPQGALCISRVGTGTPRSAR